MWRSCLDKCDWQSSELCLDILGSWKILLLTLFFLGIFNFTNKSIHADDSQQNLMYPLQIDNILFVLVYRFLSFALLIRGSLVFSCPRYIFDKEKRSLDFPFFLKRHSSYNLEGLIFVWWCMVKRVEGVHVIHA